MVFVGKVSSAAAAVYVVKARRCFICGVLVRFLCAGVKVEVVWCCEIGGIEPHCAVRSGHAAAA